MLGQHVQAAGAGAAAVQGHLAHGVDRRLAFQHLEPVGRDQHRFAGPVETVVGAADPLQQTGGALGRADLDDQIDRPPVDPEIERGSRHHRPQIAARHRRLDLAPLFAGERTMVQGDRQVFVVFAPQGLENDLRLGACVDEDDGGLAGADQFVNLSHRVDRHMAGPGQTFRAQRDGYPRLHRVGALDQADRLGGRRARRQIRPQRFRMGDRRRQTDPPHARR